MLAISLLASVVSAHGGGGGGGTPYYHYNNGGLVLFWFLIVIVGIVFLGFACSGVYYWHGHQHTYRHGYVTVLDEEGNPKQLPYREFEDTDTSDGDYQGTGHHHRHSQYDSAGQVSFAI